MESSVIDISLWYRQEVVKHMCQPHSPHPYRREATVVCVAHVQDSSRHDTRLSVPQSLVQLVTSVVTSGLSSFVRSVFNDSL